MLLIALLVHSVEIDRVFYSGIIPKGAAVRHRRLTPDFPARLPGEPRVLSKRQGLTTSQEYRRIEGLRILARIIARHYMAHPELYPDPKGPDGTGPSLNRHAHGEGEANGRGSDHGS